MTSDSAKGTPFHHDSPEPVDDWSRELFDILSTWSEAKAAEWSRWDPGYLVLEIKAVGGEEIEPIIIDTADGELTVTFGYWETHLPTDFDADAQQTAAEAKELIERWLTGQIRTAVYSDGSGKWCGTHLIEGENLLAQLNTNWIATFNPTEVEVRTPRRSQWRRFLVDGPIPVETPNRS